MKRELTKTFTKIVLVFCVCTSQVLFAQVQVIDDFGNEVSLSAPAERIVSLAPHVTESLFAAGAGDKIVATVQFSDFPAAAADIPQIGSSREISLESLVSADPDLVIIWASFNGEELAERIKSLGYTVYLDEPRRLEDIANAISRFGTLAGTGEVAEAAAKDFTMRLNRLRDSYSNLESVKVFYEIWNEPLTTLNGDHLISDIIQMCGGRNVFEAAIPIAPVVSTESVLSADPQLIVVSGMDEERPEWLDEWQDWPGLSAAENGHLRFIPPDLLQRSAPRVIQGAEMMCEYISDVRSDVRDDESGQEMRAN